MCERPEAPKRQRGKIRRFLTPAVAVAAIGLAAFLVYRTLTHYQYDQLVASVTAIPPWRLLLAGLFAACSYLCLSFFDLMGVRYVGHHLPWRTVALISFTSLSIGHNIGFSALGSGSIRYRLYSRHGLSAVEIAKIIVFCGATVVIGLMSLAGVALLARVEHASRMLDLPVALVVALGVVCLALPALYLARAAPRPPPLRWRGLSLAMPSPALALAQVILGPLDFACVAACLHQLLSALGHVDYLSVATAYIVANVATLIVHAPGGLGVIESVVLFLLPDAEFIGALLAFRFVYYLVPLAFGLVLFAASELTNRRAKPFRQPGTLPEPTSTSGGSGASMLS